MFKRLSRRLRKPKENHSETLYSNYGDHALEDAFRSSERTRPFCKTLQVQNFEERNALTVQEYNMQSYLRDVLECGCDLCRVIVKVVKYASIEADVDQQPIEMSLRNCGLHIRANNTFDYQIFVEQRMSSTRHVDH